MRHNRATNRLSRTPGERKALLRCLVTSLLVHQQIKTTLPKAKFAKRLADKVISLGKVDSLASRRHVFSYLQDHQLTSKVFKEVAPRFKSRAGGYTRILQLGNRKGDNAQLAILELTEKEIKVKEAPKSKKKDLKGKAQDASAQAGKGHEGDVKGHTHGEKEPHIQKPGGDKQQKGFFKNISKFFRNKGGAA